VAGAQSHKQNPTCTDSSGLRHLAGVMQGGSVPMQLGWRTKRSSAGVTCTVPRRGAPSYSRQLGPCTRSIPRVPTCSSVPPRSSANSCNSRPTDASTSKRAAFSFSTKENLAAAAAGRLDSLWMEAHMQLEPGAALHVELLPSAAPCASEETATAWAHSRPLSDAPEGATTAPIGVLGPFVQNPSGWGLPMAPTTALDPFPQPQS
jgi:hypothetical protein